MPFCSTTCITNLFFTTPPTGEHFMKKKETWLIPAAYEDDLSQADLVRIKSLLRIPAVIL